MGVEYLAKQDDNGTAFERFLFHQHVVERLTDYIIARTLRTEGSQ